MSQSNEQYTTKQSRWTVAETVRRIEALIAEKGIALFATIDQRAAAREVGLDLRETVLIVFGSPAAGTPVMDAVPLAALDLPLKILVWDQQGQTQVSYLKPAALAGRYQLPAALAAPLAAVDGLTDAVLSG